VVVPSHDGETWSVSVAKSYTYTPFGGFYEGQCVENIDNPFKFTGQWHDAEIDQYYLRARMYDPAMMRFTGRDPVEGEYEEPSTLHKYLYVANDPLNKTDLTGESAIQLAHALVDAATTYAVGIEIATWAFSGEGINLDFVVVGGAIAEMSSFVFAVSYASMNTACFLAGTEILTLCGEVPIEQIRPGWYVWSTNTETGESGFFVVTQCFKRQVEELVLVTIGDETIETTREHPFYVYGKGWCLASDLDVEMKLVNVSYQPVRIDNIEYVSGCKDVYNFEVDHTHTYYVSDKHLLVHNTCGNNITVGDLLKQRKGSIKNAPLPKGSPSWDQIYNLTLREIEDSAKKGVTGYKTILKLLKDGRFKK